MILLAHYQSIAMLKQLFLWISGLISAGLTLRCINDFFDAYNDPEIGFKEALKKVKRRIYAAVIALTATGFVAWIESFFT